MTEYIVSSLCIILNIICGALLFYPWGMIEGEKIYILTFWLQTSEFAGIFGRFSVLLLVGGLAELSAILWTLITVVTDLWNGRFSSVYLISLSFTGSILCSVFLTGSFLLGNSCVYWKILAIHGGCILASLLLSHFGPNLISMDAPPKN